jgi:hypothetical protein
MSEHAQDSSGYYSSYFDSPPDPDFSYGPDGQPRTWDHAAQVWVVDPDWDGVNIFAEPQLEDMYPEADTQGWAEPDDAPGPAVEDALAPPMSAAEVAQELAELGYRPADARQMVRDYVDETSAKVGVRTDLWALDRADVDAIAKTYEWVDPERESLTQARERAAEYAAGWARRAEEGSPAERPGHAARAAGSAELWAGRALPPAEAHRAAAAAVHSAVAAAADRLDQAPRQAEAPSGGDRAVGWAAIGDEAQAAGVDPVEREPTVVLVDRARSSVAEAVESAGHGVQEEADEQDRAEQLASWHATDLAGEDIDADAAGWQR